MQNKIILSDLSMPKRCGVMRRCLYFSWVLPFLLIGMGFMLGHYYAGYGGLSHQEDRLSWAASYPLAIAGGSSPSFSAGMLPDAPWKQEPGEDILFPARVGSLHMDKLITGTEALEHALRIHGDDAPFDSVFIPYYSSRDEQATVWIFEIHSTHAAIKHLIKINNYIMANHDPNNHGSFYLQDVKVFHLQGCSENYYYYRKDNNIYWISLITNDPIPLFLRFYEHF